MSSQVSISMAENTNSQNNNNVTQQARIQSREFGIKRASGPTTPQSQDFFKKEPPLNSSCQNQQVLNNQSRFLNMNQPQSPLLSRVQAYGNDDQNINNNTSTNSCAMDVNLDIIDALQPTIAQDLLNNSTNEWRQVQDIVKLTLKALADVVKCQGASLRELEREMPFKCSKIDLTSALASKANVDDLRGGINSIHNLSVSGLPAVNQGVNHPTNEDFSNLLEEKVNKKELHYMLCNKVSIEEFQRIVDNKISNYDAKQLFGQLEDRIIDLRSDLSKQFQGTASQRELNQLSALVDKKAFIDDVNESLQQKANKTTIQNALSRKADKEVLDQALQTKADVSDVETLVGIIEEKASKSEMQTNRTQFATLSELEKQLSVKADQSDLEHLLQATHQMRQDQEQRITSLTNDRETFKTGVNDIKYSFECLRNQLIESLAKKADYSLLDKVREQVSTKIDADYLMGQFKQLQDRIQTQIETAINDSEFARNTIELRNEVLHQVNEPQILHSTEIAQKPVSSRSHHHPDYESFKDQLAQQVTTDRKKHIEETADLVKDLLQGQRADVSKIINNFKQEMTDRIRITSEQDQKRTAALIADKVEMRQLNESLESHFNRVSDKMRFLKEELESLCNSTSLDLSRKIDHKLSHAEIEARLKQIQPGSQFQLQELKQLVSQLEISVLKKVDLDLFDDHILQMQEKLDKFSRLVDMKSNINDVCALIDLKANQSDLDDQFKALNTHLNTKSVNKDDYIDSLNSQHLINQVLCKENSIGRWQWSSGQLSKLTNNLMPWENEIVNTTPDNYLYEQDSSSILTVEPGIYQFQLALFNSRNCTLSIVVNGETIFQTDSANQLNQNTSINGNISSFGQPQILQNHHQSKEIVASMEVAEYLNLPAKARISVCIQRMDQGILKSMAIMQIRKVT